MGEKKRDGKEKNVSLWRRQTHLEWEGMLNVP